MENQNDKDKRDSGLPCDGDQGEGQRLYFVANASRIRLNERKYSRGVEGTAGAQPKHEQIISTDGSVCNGPARLVADATHEFIDRSRHGRAGRRSESADRGELGDAEGADREISVCERGSQQAVPQPRGAGGPCNGFWRDAVWLPCRDGKARPVEPCVEPMADGIAGDLGLVRLESYPDHPHKERIIYAPLIQKGKARVGRLRGYGNAIVCPVATEFIRAYMEVLHD